MKEVFGVDNQALQDRVKQLEAENKALRAAIAHFPERTEGWDDDSFFEECPYCGSWDEHKSKCIRNLIPGRGDGVSQDKMPDISALGPKPTDAAPKGKKPSKLKKIELPGIKISWRIDR